MPRKKPYGKESQDEFWRLGQSLIENSLILADLYSYFTEKDRKSKQTTANTSRQSAVYAFSEEKKRAIEQFATTRVNDRFTVYEKLPKMIAPYISGNEELKLALCYSLSSSPEKPIHLLMIGNPASVKSDLLAESKKIFPESIFGGPRSTAAGLTINSQDGSPGLLLRANQEMVLIDELDKIQKSEINSTYEAMESGKISVNTGKFRGDYPTRFVAIAAANPKGGRFSDEVNLIRPQIEAVIPPPLLSRFHFVFVLRKESREKIQDAVTAILTRKEKESYHWEFLRDYFTYIKQTNNSIEYDMKRDDPLIQEMSAFVVDALEKSEKGEILIPLTKRFAVGLKRVALCSARMRLSRRVEEVDIKNAIEVYDSMLKLGAR